MQFTQSRQFSGQADPVLDVISTDYKLFVLQVGTGVDVDYVILSETGVQWEAGTGQLAVGGAITRDTVTDNSLGTTAKVDFDVGRHLVIVLEQAGGGGGGPATGAITVSFDGAGAVVAAGSEHMIRMPYAGTITAAYLTGDGATGSAVVDVLKSNRASIPPSASICASAKPTITTAKSSDDTTLSGWTTTFAEGDAITVHVESCTTFEKLELQLTTERT